MLSLLEEQELKLVMLALSSSCIIDVTDGNGNIIYINDLFSKVSGYSSEELIGNSHKIINSSLHSQEFFAYLWNTLLEGKPWRGEIRNRHKNGTHYWVQTTITPFLKDDPKKTRFIAVHKTITKAKQNQLYLEKTQREFEEINFALNQTAIVAVTDVSGIITYANERFCDISKYKKEELIGKTHQIINSNYHPLSFFKELWITISRGNIWRGDIKNRAKDGSYYWVDTTIIPFLDKSGHPLKYTAIRQEITEKKDAEEKLQKERANAMYAEKMASLGELSAGIAHELGNPLAAMRGRLELLDMQICDSSIQVDNKKTSEIIQKSISLADRMSKIIRGLRSYARDGSNDPMTPTSLNQLISDIIDISNSKFRKSGIENIRVNIDTVVNTNCREAEIGQVIVNLINNACDAIKDLSDKWIEINLIIKGKNVIIQVIDSGKGISKENREKIFTPHYTTKPVGRGTGLGLSISKNILTAHSGKLQINEKHPNTCFEAILPYFNADNTI